MILCKVATAMFGYMTELSSIDIARTVEVTAEGTVTRQMTNWMNYLKKRYQQGLPKCHDDKYH